MIKLNRALFVCASMFLLLFSCNKKEETPAPKPVTKKAEPRHFVPNDEGKVTKEQVISWNRANTSLNELIVVYKDSLNLTDTAAYVTQKKNYESARDSICTEAGFIGNFVEYQWVTLNINNTINAPLLDSLGMK